jgi:hypothetical protein
MPTIFGHLVKINASRKLMLRVSDDTFDRIDAATFSRVPFYKHPHFTLSNDNGKEMSATPGRAYFCMVTLDKYDKQRMERFESLVRKDVVIDYKLAKYDFEAEGDHIEGVNLQLLRIRLYKGKEPLFPTKDAQCASSGRQPEESESESESEEEEEEEEEEEDDVDRAARAAVSQQVRPLNALEQHVDRQLQLELAERFNLPAVSSLPAGPPSLVRQTAIGEASTQRRRRRS